MKVAIDVSPLQTGHKFRGIGVYTKNLIGALQSIGLPNFSVQLIKQGKIPNDCDVVHYPYFDFFSLTLPFKKLKPTIVTIHDVIPLIFPKQYPAGIKGKIKFQIQKLSLKGVKAVITDSQNSRKDITKYLSFPKEKVFVIPLAPGKEFKKLKIENLKLKIKQKYQLPDNFVLYVGDVNYNKNIQGLIKAFKYTSEKSKPTSEVKLVLVGKSFLDEGLKETNEIVQLIKSLGLINQIICLGWIPDKDLVAIYNLATVYCQPSFYEGFGLSVLEAMACGCPVLAAKTSSLLEICDDAALMVNPYDINDVVKGITKVMDDKKLQKIMKKKGLKWVEKFSWQKVARQTYEVYQKVVQG